MAMKRLYWRLFPLGLSALLFSGIVWSQSWSFRDPHDPVPHNAEEYEWEEDQVNLPPYPNEADFLEINFQRPDSRYRFYTDPGSLSVGKDGVVRYVVILESASGVRNVMYEGIRCDEYDYKTLAYGNRRGEFKRLRNPKWREIATTGSNWYRHALWKRYFCMPESDLGPPSRQEIITSIRYYRDTGQGRD